jgi:predicted RNase H-like HicB family nuclease
MPSEALAKEGWPPRATADRSIGNAKAAVGVVTMESMNLKLECEQESDGRWLAEVPQLPGVLAYGANPEDAMAKAEALALRVLAERLENGEARPVAINISLQSAA